MTPDDQNNGRMGTPLIPQRSYLHTDPTPERSDEASRRATAEIARDQLNTIYRGNTSTPTPQTTPVAPEQAPKEEETANPYERTQENPATVQADQWKQYHSAWQDYYQKYYERYYLGQVHQAKQELASKAQTTATTETEPASNSTGLSHDEALYDLRSKLLGKLQASAHKVRHSRHFIPIAGAVGVMILFLFLQYNRVLFANVQAYISPGNINPANFIVNPTATLSVSPEPKLIIPKINVDVPVVYDVTPDYDAQMKAMESGVAYFGIPGASSKPGQVGNTVLSGHSSNDIVDKGDYKFIFARLDQLEVNDSIYVNYQGTRYTYTVTNKKVVGPSDVQALVYPTTRPILTLITCTPLGTSLNRLLVTAEQVSPDPAAASAAPATSSNPSTTTMPGNSPTLLQRVFGN